jgi:hypothetical protein
LSTAPDDPVEIVCRCKIGGHFRDVDARLDNQGQLSGSAAAA